MITKSNNGVYDRVLGCLLGGEIGDAMDAPGENITYQGIIDQYGEITDFTGSGTDDSALKYILCDAIIRSDGYPSADLWAEEWLIQEDLFLKKNLFWISVMNGVWKVLGEEIVSQEDGIGNMASSSPAMCISPMGIINPVNPQQAALETFEVASLIHHNFCRDANPDHLDSQHHSSNFTPPLFERMLRLAEQLDCPIRKPSFADYLPQELVPENTMDFSNVFNKYHPKTTQVFIGSFYDESATLELITSIFHQIAEDTDYETFELMCHPAFVDDDLRAATNYNEPRARELAILEDDKIKKLVKDLGSIY